MSRIVTRRVRIEVEFHHVDMMRVAHNAQYLRWFEKGRMAVLEEIFPLDWAIEERIGTPVVLNHCEYLWPAVYGDELVVTTRHRKLDSYEGRMTFDHSISHARRKLELARGRTAITAIDMAGGRPLRRIPEEAWRRYRELE
ncbi:MAG: thioesterase family protein [Polyangia bacterium]